jgi:hypothetical protein
MTEKTETNTAQSNVTQLEDKPQLTAHHYAALIRKVREDLVAYEIEHKFSDDATGIHLSIDYPVDA